MLQIVFEVCKGAFMCSCVKSVLYVSCVVCDLCILKTGGVASWLLQSQLQHGECCQTKDTPQEWQEALSKYFLKGLL